VTFIFAGMRRLWVYTKVKPGQHLLLDLSRRQGAHPGGLFGCHDRPLCTAGTQH